MKKLASSLLLFTLLFSTHSFASTENPVMSIFTTANWSNVQIVNKNNPSIVCAQSGKIHSGTTINITTDQLNSDDFKKCSINDSYGVIFYGNLSGNAFLPQVIKPGDHCTASYSWVTGLQFSC